MLPNSRAFLFISGLALYDCKRLQGAESEKSGPDSPGKGELAETSLGLKFSPEGKNAPPPFLLLPSFSFSVFFSVRELFTGTFTI